MRTAQGAKRDRCCRELADVDAGPALVLMPGLAERYRKSIEDLSVTLCGDLVEVQQAREMLPPHQRLTPCLWPVHAA